jgi:hypothetical protein
VVEMMSDAGPLHAVGEHRVRLTEQEALLNLRTMLELCAAGEVRCGEKTGRPAAATVRTVDSHLVHGDFYANDPIASLAWPLLIQAGGLAKIESGRLQLTPRARTALRTPPAEVLRALWQRWLTHAVIDEFSRIEEIKGQRASNVLTAAKTRRQTVATALATCPPDEWIGVDALFTILRRARMSQTIARNEGDMEACTWSTPSTAVWATTASTPGRPSKAATHWRCCSSTPLAVLDRRRRAGLC